MRDDTAGWRWLLFVLVSPRVSRLGDGRGASFLWPVAAAGRRAGAPNFEVASAVAWQSEAYWGRWQCWSRRGSELRRVGRSWTPLSRVGGCARWWTGRGCWDAETRGSAIDSAICVCRGSVLGRCVLCGCKRGRVAGGLTPPPRTGVVGRGLSRPRRVGVRYAQAGGASDSCTISGGASRECFGGGLRGGLQLQEEASHRREAGLCDMSGRQVSVCAPCCIFCWFVCAHPQLGAVGERGGVFAGARGI